ncbi:hypothetical protein [Ruegeria sp.]|uniref:hypothetical protein n=1 Tax=Ruegeria sp. TaxID=1879320 RepID=UPI003C7C809E
MENDYCVFSSWQELPDFYFQGYCFVGADFVFGPGGAKKFLSAGGVLGSGEDGCYLLFRRHADQITIGSDFSGHMRLFYFSDGENWAVSNSLIQLAEHLKANGIRLHIQRHHLAAWFTRNVNFKQLLCEETVLKEIRFLPSDMEIVISGKRLELRPRRLPLIDTYDTALQSYLTLWRDRTATVLQSGVAAVSTDVSGGLDTRAVVGFLKVAGEEAVQAHDPKIRYVTTSGPNFERDEEVANLVADSLEWQLEPQNRFSKPYLRSPQQLLDLWRNRSLGQYATIRFSDALLDPRKIVCGGEAGEGLRGIYDQADIDSYLDFQKGFYGSYMYGDKARWAQDVKTSIRALEDRTAYYQQPLLGYFRQYRSRCHGGMRPRNNVAILPLTGQAAYQCTAALSNAAVRSGQVLYDTMYNLHPELIDIPFDDEKKAATAENRANLTKVALRPSVGGRFFVSETDIPAEPEGSGSRHKEVYRHFVDYLQDTVANIPKNTVPQGYISAVIDRLHARGEGDLTVMPNDTIPAHNLALFGDLIKLAEWPESSGLTNLKELVGYWKRCRKT